MTPNSSSITEITFIKGEESETDEIQGGIEPRNLTLTHGFYENIGSKHNFINDSYTIGEFFEQPQSSKSKTNKTSYGVPGKTGTGALQRTDLGSVPSLVHNYKDDRLQVKPCSDDNTGFIGTLTNMFFGRKGGLS